MTKTSITDDLSEELEYRANRDYVYAIIYQHCFCCAKKGTKKGIVFPAIKINLIMLQNPFS